MNMIATECSYGHFTAILVQSSRNSSHIRRQSRPRDRTACLFNSTHAPQTHKHTHKRMCNPTPCFEQPTRKEYCIILLSQPLRFPPPCPLRSSSPPHPHPPRGQAGLLGNPSQALGTARAAGCSAPASTTRRPAGRDRAALPAHGAVTLFIMVVTIGVDGCRKFCSSVQSTKHLLEAVTLWRRRSGLSLTEGGCSRVLSSVRRRTS